MNWKLAISALTLGLVFVGTAGSVTGCAADATEAGDEGDSEEAAATADELSSNANRLVGAYLGSGGSMRPPTFQGLVLERNGTFFADVDTGIRCIVAPCPSHVRLEGKFSATRNYVRLDPAAGQQAHSFHGRYRYTLTGNKLSLSRTGQNWSGWNNSLEKKSSYCAEAVDCGGQELIHPMCVGSWTCSEQRSCGWKCGIPTPVNAVWPADAKTLVAQTSGGGFTPPPPPGSNCNIGAAKYSLDIATKKLAYSQCKFVDWNTPLTTVSGNKTLTAAQVAKVDAAMDTVAITTETICGADKPLLTITVSSPSQGTKTFKDSFYSCDGNGPYVDNIDEVFRAFREIVGE